MSYGRKPTIKTELTPKMYSQLIKTLEFFKINEKNYATFLSEKIKFFGKIDTENNKAYIHFFEKEASYLIEILLVFLSEILNCDEEIYNDVATKKWKNEDGL